MKKLFLALCCCGMFVGCGYEELSPEAYQYSKALYSICNRCDNEKLTKFVDQVAAAEEEQRISSQEAIWLNDIVITAQTGEWPSATQEARRMMEDQIQGP